MCGASPLRLPAESCMADDNRSQNLFRALGSSLSETRTKDPDRVLLCVCVTMQLISGFEFNAFYSDFSCNQQLQTQLLKISVY
jgi:hypothetical protein